ncbi:hypothetical protein, partial [Streptomyces canus]|uniref:hypothetical protein n=1 Tax=Streptomyces canus TaxID=58343 RepID=UPI002E2CB42E
MSGWSAAEATGRPEAGRASQREARRLPCSWRFARSACRLAVSGASRIRSRGAGAAGVRSTPARFFARSA